MRKLLVGCTVSLAVAVSLLIFTLSASSVFADEDGDATDAATAERDPEAEAPAGEQDGDGLHGSDDADEPHDGGHAKGVPLAWKTDLALWSLVVFIAFILVLSKFAWGPLSEGLDKREASIRQDIADAESARVKAEQMLAEHAKKLDGVQDEVREILAEARRDADHAKQEIISTAQSEAEATRKRAVGEIERAKDQAIEELFDAMATRIVDATEHVLGRSLSEADQQRFIDEALSQFSESSS